LTLLTPQWYPRQQAREFHRDFYGKIRESYELVPTYCGVVEGQRCDAIVAWLGVVEPVRAEHLVIGEVERAPHPADAAVRRVGRKVPRAAAGRAADEVRDEGPPPPVHPPGLTASASPRVEGLGNGGAAAAR
jgi:hypothetical protein